MITMNDMQHQEHTFGNSVPAQWIQLTYFARCTLFPRVFKGFACHASFNQPRTDRVDTNISFLKLISGGHGD